MSMLHIHPSSHVTFLPLQCRPKSCIKQVWSFIMPPRRPPNFYKTVGRMAVATGLGPGVRVGIRQPEVQQGAPRIHVPGVGVLPLGGRQVEAPSSSSTLQSLETDVVPQESAAIALVKEPVLRDGPLGRAEAPVIKKARKASLQDALKATLSDEAKAAALDDLEFDKVANSARASRASTWATWARMHNAWFGNDVPVLPLSVIKIKAVAAMFKAGHYTAFSNYASRAKAEHIEQFHAHGVPWSEELAVELKGALRSITRGRGTAKQSYPVDLAKVASLGCLDTPLVEGGPIGITDLIIIGTFFMARELEIACAKCGNFHIASLEAEVTWNMPVAKNDVQALGTHRTWGCTCGTSLTIGCPFHAALRQVERLRILAAEVGCPLSELPFFPDNVGKVVDKVAVVASITKVMEMCGLPLKDALGRPMYGGHSLRTAGASLLASLGIDTTRIEAMARWNSPMLLYYIRSAPLKSITNDFKLLAKAQKNKLSEGGAPVRAQVDAKSTLVLSRLIERLDSAVATSSANEDRLAALEKALAPSKYIKNCSSGVWHHTREHAAGARCFTACGWQYTGLQFIAQPELPALLSHKVMCGTCLPASRLLASLD